MPWPCQEMTWFMLAGVYCRRSWKSAYSLCDIVDDNSAICISVVHRSKRLVSFLSCRIPYFKFDGSGVIERDCLSEERSSNGGFSIVVKLVLPDVLSHSAPKYPFCRSGQFMNLP